jgi:outer membrane protein OmpA-like peptidoglycan-associated protein
MSAYKPTCHQWRTASPALICCSALGLVLAACSNGEPPSYPDTAGNHQFQVPFSTGRSALTPYSQDLIATVAHTVRAEPGARVLVVGKADTVGSASQNWSLSRKRAQAVKDSLVAAGVPPDEIRMSRTGEDQLNVPTGNNVSEWRNRTVDIMVP